MQELLLKLYRPQLRHPEPLIFLQQQESFIYKIQTMKQDRHSGSLSQFHRNYLKIYKGAVLPFGIVCLHSYPLVDGFNV